MAQPTYQDRTHKRLQNYRLLVWAGLAMVAITTITGAITGIDGAYEVLRRWWPRPGISQLKGEATNVFYSGGQVFADVDLTFKDPPITVRAMDMVFFASDSLKASNDWCKLEWCGFRDTRGESIETTLTITPADFPPKLLKPSSTITPERLYQFGLPAEGRLSVFAHPSYKDPRVLPLAVQSTVRDLNHRPFRTRLVVGYVVLQASGAACARDPVVKGEFPRELDFLQPDKLESFDDFLRLIAAHPPNPTPCP